MMKWFMNRRRKKVHVDEMQDGLLSLFTCSFPYRDPKLLPNSPYLCHPCQQHYYPIKS
jgi:hypothetical protein